MDKIKRWVMLSMMLGFLTACTISTPFSGPGYSMFNGVTVDNVDTVYVGLTNGSLQDGKDKGKVFYRYSGNVIDSLDNQAGLIGHKRRKKIFGNEFWTMTVWEDEASLDAFVKSDVHQTAMREAFPLVSVARFARIELPIEEIPISWERADEILDTHGRTYRFDGE